MSFTPTGKELGTRGSNRWTCARCYPAQRLALQRHERLPDRHGHVQRLACGFPALEPIMNAKDE